MTRKLLTGLVFVAMAGLVLPVAAGKVCGVALPRTERPATANRPAGAESWPWVPAWA